MATDCIQEKMKINMRFLKHPEPKLQDSLRCTHPKHFTLYNRKCEPANAVRMFLCYFITEYCCMKSSTHSPKTLVLIVVPDRGSF